MITVEMIITILYEGYDFTSQIDESVTWCRRY